MLEEEESRQGRFHCWRQVIPAAASKKAAGQRGSVQLFLREKTSASQSSGKFFEAFGSFQLPSATRQSPSKRLYQAIYERLTALRPHLTAGLPLSYATVMVKISAAEIARRRRRLY